MIFNFKKIMKASFAISCLITCCVHAAAQYGIVNSDEVAAKELAMKDNRPLLVVASMKNCDRCDAFHNSVISSSTFLKWTKENKIVVYSSKLDDKYRYSKLVSTWGGYSKGTLPPYMFLFKVKSNTVKDTSDDVFSNKQVSILKSEKYGDYAAVSLAGESSRHSMTVSYSSVQATENLLSSFFPNVVDSENSGWTTLTPPAVTPEQKDDPKQDTPKQDEPKQDTPKQDEPKQDEPKEETTYTMDEKDFGFVYSDEIKAKSVALKSNRPLLVVASMKNCDRCDAFHSSVITSSTFLKWTKDNRIVVYSSKLDDKYRYSKLVSTWGGYSKGTLPPYIFLFKVNSNTVKDTSDDVFSNKQVSILKSQQYSDYAAVSMVGESTRHGTSVNYQSVQATETLISSFFPNVVDSTNDGWTTLKPPADTPAQKDDPKQDDPKQDDPKQDDPKQDDPKQDDPKEETYTIDEKDFGFVYSDEIKAKSVAKKSNRPLLVIASMKNCDRCDEFHSSVITSSSFLKWTQTNKIVVYSSKLDDKYRYSKLVSTWGGYSKGTLPPYMFLFKVNSNTASSTSDDVFNTKQVSILKSEKYGDFAAVSMVGESTRHGISVSYSSISSTENLIASFFPNVVSEDYDGWTDIDPSKNTTPSSKDDDKKDDDKKDDDKKDDKKDDDSGNTTPSKHTTLDDADYGFVYSDEIAAKAVALKDNRPMIVVASMKNCDRCDEFHSSVITSSSFLKWTQTNKIVVYSSKLDDKYRYSKLVSTWGGYSKGTLPPYLFIFKVISNTAKSSSDDVFSNKQVSILKSSKFNDCAAVSMVGEKSRHNLTVDYTSVSLTEKLIESFFPNEISESYDGWETLAPPDDQPTGYENAQDLGQLPNFKKQPEEVGKWEVAAGTVSLTGAEIEKWYKFTGTPGKRFYFYTDAIYASSGAKYTMVAELYGVKNGVPVSPILAEATSNNLDDFNKGFYFDTTGTASSAVYYLRIGGTGGTSSTSVQFNLKVHETTASPAKGSLTNPTWTGATIDTWTMDVDAAMKNAYSNNIPVIAYFSGLAWCPRCVKMETTVINQSTFNTLSAYTNAYRVVFDNRRRDGTGPSLLTDKSGYMKANSISQSTAENKLKDNYAWQEELALPNGAATGPIGYPTMLYCRVVKSNAHASGYTLEPIGRFDYTTTIDFDINKITQLRTLFENGYRESSLYRETSIEDIPSGEQISTFMTGDLAFEAGKKSEYWATFTEDDGESWIFALNAEKANNDATATISIYSETGNEPLKQISGKLGEIVLGTFTPETTEEHTYWMKITVENQDEIIPCTLSTTQQRITSAVSFEKTEIAVSNEAESVTVPLKLNILQREENMFVAFAVTVSSAEVNGAPESCFKPVTLDDDECIFLWPDINQDTAYAELTLYPSSINWKNGYKDIVVKLTEAKEYTGCIVEGSNTATVHITSKSMFMPKLESNALTFYKGLYSETYIPLCLKDGATLDASALAGLKSYGLKYTVNLNTEQPNIKIYGTPSKTLAAKDYELTVSDGQTVTDSLTVSVTVAKMTNDAVKKDAFVASLKEDSDESGVISGMLIIEKQTQGLKVTLFDVTKREPLTISVPQWTEYDPKSNTLLLQASMNDGSKIHVLVNSDGTGDVSCVAAGSIGLYGKLYPSITDKTAAAEFTGMYNVAIRPQDDADGMSEGWMHIEIGDNGLSSIKIRIYDGDFTSTISSYIYMEKGSTKASVPFYMTTDFTTSSFISYISGVLDITPASERDPESVDVCISSCKSDISYLVTSTETLQVNVCGTVYMPDKSIQECIQSDYYYFVTEQFGGAGTIVPSAIRVIPEGSTAFYKENEDSLIGSFLSNIAIDQKTGTFETNIAVLTINSQNNVNTEEVPVSGIIVPTSKLCCSESDNVAIAYGVFYYGSAYYRICIFPNQIYQQNTLPTPEAEDTTEEHTPKDGSMYYFFSNVAEQTLLMRRQSDGTIFGMYWNSSKTYAPNDFEMYDTSSWLIESVSKSGENPPSELVRIEVKDLPYSYTISRNGNFQLKDGWNLIGIPDTLEIPQNQDFNMKNVYTFNNNTQTMEEAKTIEAGNAYWIFEPASGEENSAQQEEQQEVQQELRPNALSELTRSVVRRDTKDDISITFKAAEFTPLRPKVISEGWTIQAAPASVPEGVIVWKWQAGQYVLVDNISELGSKEGVILYRK